MPNSTKITKMLSVYFVNERFEPKAKFDQRNLTFCTNIYHQNVFTYSKVMLLRTEIIIMNAITTYNQKPS